MVAANRETPSIKGFPNRASRALPHRSVKSIRARERIAQGATIPVQANHLGSKLEFLVRGAAKSVYGEPGEGKRVWYGKTKKKFHPHSHHGAMLVTLFVAERERQENVQRMILGRDPKVRDLRSLLPDDACVFPSDVTTAGGLHAPYVPKHMSQRFKTVAIRAGLPKVSPHYLRHAAISHAIAEGTPLADASKRAGHKNPAVTAAIYTHAVSENERKAAMIGDSLLRPEQPASSQRKS